jgi:hypothetical protein
MKFAKPLVIDAVRLALGISLYALLSAIPELSSFTGSIAGKLTVAVISAFILVFVVDVLLGRPTLQAVWTIRNAPPEESWPRVSRTLGDTAIRTPISLKYRLKGTGVLFALVKWLSNREDGHISCEIVFDPREVAEALIEKGQANGHHSTEGCAKGVLVSHFKGGLGPLGTPLCVFEIVCFENYDQDQHLGCKMKLHRARRQRLIRWLVKCDPTIEGFIVGSA